MAPSRGGRNTAAIETTQAADEIAAVQKSQSALVSAKRNFRYLFNPNTQADHPARLRTRALLRSIRYFCTFIMWRLVRYSKALVAGALITALGATAFGSVITGVAWIAVPTSITAVIASGTVWTLGKWAVMRYQRRQKPTKTGNDMQQTQERKERDPGAPPW